MMQTSPSAPPVVILNPASNRGNMDRFRHLVRSRAEAEGAEYVESQRRGDASDVARRAAETGRGVVVVGGDGSINEVVNGLLAAQQRVPLGIVPAGSGNDFACNTLGLPRDTAQAVERAFTGTPMDADAGIANGRYFANSFSVGLDADVTVASEHLKRFPFMTGTTLYYTSSLQRLFFGYRKCPWLTLTIDGLAVEGPEVSRHVLVAVMNGPTYGGGFRINPKANHTDGIFDVCSIRYISRLRAMTLLPVVKRGAHENEPEVRFYHGQTLGIDCPTGVNAQMDGETLRDTHYDVRVLPAALFVRV
ncbi:MAG: diacylglycerol kinase family lipid kinase [Ktedonobacterales bacterium]|nr:diacylglycerol kinase family lipid kinase [Ktedonobacterales bacterium]